MPQYAGLPEKQSKINRTEAAINSVLKSVDPGATGLKQLETRESNEEWIKELPVISREGSEVQEAPVYEEDYEEDSDERS
ncbi:unnamed protein product [Protopolystoma xenopodis]|uniref:Uncharacterized protein n=1 Tax=Protopolystoma xenopodis TaxID=117903 RepID=A0A3S5FCN4_9PLAT|nr:unnamed protein product [Protopolystoma xenopodis]